MNIITILSLVIADFTADNLTCSDSYPEVPSSIQMSLYADQPELMCPGEKVKYECNSGGINVREVSNKTFSNKLSSSVSIKCIYRIKFQTHSSTSLA